MHHGATPLSPEECLVRLRETVYLRDECHIWAGPVDGGNHPRVGWRCKRWSARLLMLKLSGRLPWDAKRRVAWTTCGNSLCMAEDHILIGTRGQMARWHAARQLNSRGLTHALAIAQAIERKGTARMPMSRRQEVARMRADGASWAQIAARYGITKTAARNNFLRWERQGLVTWIDTRKAA
jgi:hypothetical protein